MKIKINNNKNKLNYKIFLKINFNLNKYLKKEKINLST